MDTCGKLGGHFCPAEADCTALVDRNSTTASSACAADCTSAPATRECEAECRCSPSATESDHKVIQRRSLPATTREQSSEWRAEVCQSERGTKVTQERILWVILLLACSVLFLSVVPVEQDSRLLAALAAASTKLGACFAPQGPFLWKLKWRFGAGPDPWPLWRADLLGTATNWPRGSAAGFAAAMGSGDSRRVAVVGNGPITDAQRQQISSADRVVRFNSMNNRRPEERVDVWVVRGNGIPPHLYWGFEQLQDAEVQQVVKQAEAVLFLDSSKGNHNLSNTVESVVFWFPDLQTKQLQQVDFADYEMLYSEMFATVESLASKAVAAMPSSGLLGLLAVLSAVGPEVAVDLYGFNWNLKSYAAHRMSQEELILRAIRQHYPRITVHPTACGGLYSCEPLCDTNQYRVAVDEENCLKQVERSRAGLPARFIDHHSLHHLEWNPELLAEILRLKPPSKDPKRLSEEWLRNATLILSGEDQPTSEGRGLPAGIDSLSRESRQTSKSSPRQTFRLQPRLNRRSKTLF